jgi:hypothetical protein
MDPSSLAVAAISILCTDSLKESAKKLGSDLYDKLKSLVSHKLTDKGLTGLLPLAESDPSGDSAALAKIVLAKELSSNQEFLAKIESLVVKIMQNNTQIQEKSAVTNKNQSVLENASISNTSISIGNINQSQ